MDLWFYMNVWNFMATGILRWFPLLGAARNLRKGEDVFYETSIPSFVSFTCSFVTS
jgi:hypothetical protein